MPQTCCVRGCSSSSKDINEHLFSVPKDERFTKWLAAFQTLNNQENICKSGRVCSKHFLEDDFLSKAKRFRLKKDAVPSIFRRTTITNNNTGASTDAVIAGVAEAASMQ